MRILNLHSIWSILENMPLFNLIFLALGLLGIFLAVYFYFRSKRYRCPVYTVRNINLIEDRVGKMGEIEILYNRSKVMNLSVARVAFWNRGQETINAADIAPSDPLKIICLDPTKFLELEIIYKKNRANNFILSPISVKDGSREDKQNELLINFDYFDHNEGIILQIFHTGKTDADIKIVGSVKGGGAVKKINDPIIEKMRPVAAYFEKIKRRRIKVILGILLMLTPILALLSILIPTPKAEESSIIKFLPFILIAIFYWTAAFSILRRRIPRGFELFEEKIDLDRSLSK